MRRCDEDKEFTSEDGPIWPMYIVKGGTLYPFCPGKVNRDYSAVELFRYLTLIAETKALPKAGGILDQDDDIIEHMSWFLPMYDQMKWQTRMDALFGNIEKKENMPKTQPSRRNVKPTPKGRGRRR